ncbi:hypothetical protein ADL22_12670 [Streptomyces sp. NRRL F-4489]|uniref:hypothetical protein n=1 Tax=Streptomyces sp. NRRL F-4489 TaxID=1609095 RepID=UPI00074A8F82|nr:hypothetical protein [Streptomyces sp. NRRL F-4489]KUL44790.1 hypothetical protein ADL22_12670 [Streptomyces sp. NRRL F-4489]
MTEKDYLNIVDPWLRTRVETMKELVDAVSLPEFETQAAEIDKLWEQLRDYEDMHRKRLVHSRKPVLQALKVDELAELHMALSSGRWPQRKDELIDAVLEMEWRDGAIWKAYRDARYDYDRFERWRFELQTLPRRLQDLENEATRITESMTAQTPAETITKMQRNGMRNLVDFHKAEAARAARLVYQEHGYHPAVLELIDRARQNLHWPLSGSLEASMSGLSQYARLLAARDLLTLCARWLPADVRPYFPSQ